MTNNQALTVSNFCGILYGSKQITFGVANRLAKNAKNYDKIQSEIAEIKARGKEKQVSDEELMKELNEFGSSDFEGEFKIIDLSAVENLSYEEIPVMLSKGENQTQENWKISDMLIYLQELEIIK